MFTVNVDYIDVLFFLHPSDLTSCIPKMPTHLIRIQNTTDLKRHWNGRTPKSPGSFPGISSVNRITRWKTISSSPKKILGSSMIPKHGFTCQIIARFVARKVVSAIGKGGIDEGETQPITVLPGSCSQIAPKKLSNLKRKVIFQSSFFFRSLGLVL